MLYEILKGIRSLINYGVNGYDVKIFGFQVPILCLAFHIRVYKTYKGSPLLYLIVCVCSSFPTWPTKLRFIFTFYVLQETFC